MPSSALPRSVLRTNDASYIGDILHVAYISVLWDRHRLYEFSLAAGRSVERREQKLRVSNLKHKHAHTCIAAC